MAGLERLAELQLTGEEVSRLGRAFQDPQFRELFRQYAEELSDPASRRLYEQEIRALERERGVEARFLHPQPGHALHTSQGSRRCYINVCAEPQVGAPEVRPGAGGQHWALPHSLAPGREELEPGGGTCLVYDVLFHPDTLHLAGSNPRFRAMVDTTAMEAIEGRFGVTLDKRNAETLGVPYHGVPQATVLRSPIPGATPVTEPSDGLSFPNPYPGVPGRARDGGLKTGGAAHVAGDRSPQTGGEASRARDGYPKKELCPKSGGEANDTGPPRPAQEQDPMPKTMSDAPTTPHYAITHRSYVDLQDYRHSRDAVPSPVPKELLVTIDLPLLKAAGDATLDIHERLLSLESQKPAYSLQVTLPYPVDETQGSAKFSKAKRQLLVTLPVMLQKCQASMNMTLPKTEEDDTNNCNTNQLVEELDSERGCQEKTGQVLNDVGPEGSPSGEPIAAGTNISDIKILAITPEGQSEDDSPADPGAPGVAEPGAPGVAEPGTPGVAEPGGLTTTEAKQEAVTLTVTEHAMYKSKDLPGDSAIKQEQSREKWLSVEDSKNVLLLEKTEPLCPKCQCTQDNTSVTLIIHVPSIDPEGLKGNASTSHYKICFSSADTHIFYSLVFCFNLGNKLNAEEVTVSVSRNNAVIQLTKASESCELWEKFCFGVDEDSLQERLFISEENVDGFLEVNVTPPPLDHSASEIHPVIEVLEVTDRLSHIRLKEPGTETSDLPGHTEQRINNTDHNKKHTVGLHLENSIETDTAEKKHAAKHAEPSVSVTNSETAEKPGHGSGHCVKPELVDGSLTLPRESLIIESGFKADVTGGKCTASFHGVKQRILHCKEETEIKEKELDEDDVPPELQDTDSSTVLSNSNESPVVEEIDPVDGSVHIITDHTTRCAFSFQNSLLYDLD